MHRKQFDGIVPFLAVAERRSFTRAAQDLQVTAAAVSKSIRELERRHGVVLLQRTTRSVGLTEAGAVLHARLRDASRDIEDAFAGLAATGEPAGTLRITLGRAPLERVFHPIVVRMRERHPRVAIELSVNEGFVDLQAAGFDAGVRLGAAVEKDMVAIRLSGALAWSLVASPAYFARMGRPKTPEELKDHEALLYRFGPSGSTHRWSFMRTGRAFTVDPPSRLTVDDRSALLAFAREGLGLAFASELETRDDVAAGRLERVLSRWIEKDEGLYLYFPMRMQTQPKLRALIETIRRPRA